jgi:hypothetical protein
MVLEYLISAIIATSPTSHKGQQPDSSHIKTLPVNPEKSDIDKILSNISYNSQTKEYFIKVTTNVANAVDDMVAMKKALRTLRKAQKFYCGEKLTEKEAKNIETEIDRLWNKYYAQAVKSNCLQEEGKRDCRIIKLPDGYKLNITHLITEFDFIPLLFKEPEIKIKKVREPYQPTKAEEPETPPTDKPGEKDKKPSAVYNNAISAIGGVTAGEGAYGTAGIGLSRDIGRFFIGADFNYALGDIIEGPVETQGQFFTSRNQAEIKPLCAYGIDLGFSISEKIALFGGVEARTADYTLTESILNKETRDVLKEETKSSRKTDVGWRAGARIKASKRFSFDVYGSRVPTKHPFVTKDHKIYDDGQNSVRVRLNYRFGR